MCKVFTSCSRPFWWLILFTEMNWQMSNNCTQLSYFIFITHIINKNMLKLLHSVVLHHPPRIFQQMRKKVKVPTNKLNRWYYRRKSAETTIKMSITFASNHSLLRLETQTEKIDRAWLNLSPINQYDWDLNHEFW